MVTDAILKRIRRRFDVPAYHGVRIKTSAGEFGIIAGGEGQSLRVWFESSRKFKYLNPDEVAYIGLELRK
ncbi:MAG: hypothetical protein PHH48_06420 [Eubacteriales bacterium]|nr:hypothetical protein [Eubacteriales bacterium]